MWLLDTNAWIRYINPVPSLVKTNVRARDPNHIFLCTVVQSELYYGSYKSPRVAQNLATLEVLSAQFVSLPFEHKAAQISGHIRAELARSGTPIGPYDLQIAAIALAHDLTLVTHNTTEFRRVAGLRLEDWEEGN